MKERVMERKRELERERGREGEREKGRGGERDGGMGRGGEGVKKSLLKIFLYENLTDIYLDNTIQYLRLCLLQVTNFY